MDFAELESDVKIVQPCSQGLSSSRFFEDCDAEYIGETTWRLGTRVNEHQKSVQALDFKSAISEHVKGTGHSLD